jgi:hypothetical protein
MNSLFNSDVLERIKKLQSGGTNGNYNIEITDNKDNVFPDFYENGIVFLLYDNILYLKKISGDWLYLHLEHPNIFMKYTLPSKYTELDNILEEKLEEMNKNNK